ncbi:protein RTF2 homolog [Mizuhopecten yessoensis]|uniref:Replication termination factor 2 n=1 Tax=Mizuhopecten yessoensis TaxID=6573 RepID=A0A210QTE4_MIZYE|nr:protein RTF2 homolog [Mizuhopecten yessoensis]OWF52009.1 Protein RTF2-like [Mizuhopecten yessoensis]
MGCDGGTIPRRDEMVRVKKKAEQKDKVAELDAKWKRCAITQEPLHPPIMACEIGKLYNKESALELLLDRTKFECASSFSHLRGFKDLKELNLTENPAYEKPENEKGDGYIDTNIAPYSCPIVGIEMNGKHRFSVLWKCGCVLSERANKEVKGQNCHKCGTPFRPEDIVILNGTEEEIDELYKRMEAKRLQAKLDKKSKKAQKHKAPEAAAGSASQETESATSSKVSRIEPSSSQNGLTNGTSSHTSKLTNGKVDYKSRHMNGKTEDSKKPKPNGSIQDNPNASTVFKSLFTTSHKAKNQQNAHWVTFNPQYN